LVKHEERKKKKKKKEQTENEGKKDFLCITISSVLMIEKENRRKQQDEIYMSNEGIIVASINAKTKDAVTRNTDAQSMNMYTYRARRH
jgi:hypothetical protein